MIYLLRSWEKDERLSHARRRRRRAVAMVRGSKRLRILPVVMTVMMTVCLLVTDIGF
jgi:hypothetical protein